jgi:N-methylhydantoinase B
MAALPYRATLDGEPLPGMNDDVPLQAGSLLRLRTTGGGGWGDPFEREPELVLRDVAQGRVSEESAARDYGVVIRDGAIVELRREGQREPRPFVDRGPGYELLRRPRA